MIKGSLYMFLGRNEGEQDLNYGMGSLVSVLYFFNLDLFKEVTVPEGARNHKNLT